MLFALLYLYWISCKRTDPRWLLQSLSRGPTLLVERFFLASLLACTKSFASQIYRAKRLVRKKRSASRVVRALFSAKKKKKHPTPVQEPVPVSYRNFRGTDRSLQAQPMDAVPWSLLARQHWSSCSKNSSHSNRFLAFFFLQKHTREHVTAYVTIETRRKRVCSWFKQDFVSGCFWWRRSLRKIPVWWSNPCDWDTSVSDNPPRQLPY